MRLSHLIEPNNLLSPLTQDMEITKIVYRIEEMEKGCLFICQKGQNTDTHQMLSYIISHGANCILVESGTDTAKQPSPIPLLPVHSTRAAMAYAYSAFYDHPAKKLHMYGITGTNGKTSSALFLDSIFRKNGFKTACIGTLGCYVDGVPYTPPCSHSPTRTQTMTTPDPDILYPLLSQLHGMGVTHVVMEISSHALSLKKVSPIHFKGVGFTNLSPEHLDFHKTMERYISAKETLFSMCDFCVINTDDEIGSRFYKRAVCRKISAGILWNADATASQIEKNGPFSMSYLFRYGNLTNLCRLKVFGTYQVYNSLLAGVMAIEAGVPPYLVFSALEEIPYIPGRMEPVNPTGSDISVYIDFAHTEFAMKSLFETVRPTLKAKERLLVVFGCGGDRDATKRAPMGKCAMEYADYTIITSDNTRTESPGGIIQDILEGHTDSQKRKVITDREKAIRYAIEIAHPHDTVLVIGKGHEQYEIKGTTLLPFHERKIIEDAIKQRQLNHTENRFS